MSFSRAGTVARAIREEIVRQYRDNERAKCPAGIPFWEEEVQPILLAEVAISAMETDHAKLLAERNELAELVGIRRCSANGV